MADPTPAQLAKARAIAGQVTAPCYDDTCDGRGCDRHTAITTIAAALADEAQQAEAERPGDGPKSTPMAAGETPTETRELIGALKSLLADGGPESDPLSRNLARERARRALRAAGIHLSATPPAGETGQRRCWHGHTKRKVGCVSCVAVFDWPAGETPQGEANDYEEARRTAGIPRYTIEQKEGTIYFRLTEDARGAWVSFANHDALVTKLEKRIARAEAVRALAAAPSAAQEQQELDIEDCLSRANEEIAKRERSEVAYSLSEQKRLVLLDKITSLESEISRLRGVVAPSAGAGAQEETELIANIVYRDGEVQYEPASPPPPPPDTLVEAGQAWATARLAMVSVKSREDRIPRTKPELDLYNAELELLAALARLRAPTPTGETR